MVTIGYVFSYLIPSKQKSVVFPIQSTQAFFIAQSGVEFAVRYATDNNWTTTGLLDANLNDVTRDLGAGRFALTYNYATYGDTLISVGRVPTNTERRRISVSNFTSFLPQGGLVLWIEPGVYQEPCYSGSNTTIRFYIRNNGSSAVTLTAFSASWTTPPNNREINAITMNTNTPFSGSYSSGGGTQIFNGGNQTIDTGQVVRVVVTWSRNISGQTPVSISFYDNSIPTTEYPFTLAPTVYCSY
jgi:hypothetical protein